MPKNTHRLPRDNLFRAWTVRFDIWVSSSATREIAFSICMWLLPAPHGFSLARTGILCPREEEVLSDLSMKNVFF